MLASMMSILRFMGANIYIFQIYGVIITMGS